MQIGSRNFLSFVTCLGRDFLRSREQQVVIAIMTRLSFSLSIMSLPIALTALIVSGSIVAAKPASTASAAPAGQQATLLASFSDWGAYATGQGKGRICYALSQPKARLPANLKDTPGYLFVSHRPAEKVRNEVSFVMGFDLKEGTDHQAVIGTTQIALLSKGGNIWVKNPADEPRLIDAMRKGADLYVKGTSKRNNPTTDRYSLKGLDDALERVQKECP
jgi:invasion protein IalB